MSRELMFYDALKRISQYESPEHLAKVAERLYGLSADEAIKMAYENVLTEAKTAIRGVRRPALRSRAKPSTTK